MKKIFTIISAVISALVVAFLITISFVKTSVAIESNNPKYVVVFNQSATSTQTNGYTVEDKEYKQILDGIKEISNISILNRLVNNTKVFATVDQDLDKTFAKWNTSLKQTNIVVELVYDKQQDVIVTYNGYTKVVSYFCLSYVIPTTDKFADIVVYYANTNNTQGDAKNKSYAECNPFVIKGLAGEFIELVDKL